MDGRTGGSHWLRSLVSSRSSRNLKRSGHFDAAFREIAGKEVLLVQSRCPVLSTFACNRTGRFFQDKEAKGVLKAAVQPLALPAKMQRSLVTRRARSGSGLSRPRLVTMVCWRGPAGWCFPCSNSEVSSQVSFESAARRAYSVFRKRTLILEDNTRKMSVALLSGSRRGKYPGGKRLPSWSMSRWWVGITR